MNAHLIYCNKCCYQERETTFLLEHLTLDSVLCHTFHDARCHDLAQFQATQIDAHWQSATFLQLSY